MVWCPEYLDMQCCIEVSPCHHCSIEPYYLECGLIAVENHKPAIVSLVLRLHPYLHHVILQ